MEIYQISFNTKTLEWVAFIASQKGNNVRLKIDAIEAKKLIGEFVKAEIISAQNSNEIFWASAEPLLVSPNKL